MNGRYSEGDVVLGSWTLVKLLGEGAYGRVYEARREEFGTVYRAAIKIMTIPPSQSEVSSARAEGMDEESVTSYFRGMVEEVVQEFALMSRLKGLTNIVSCEDFQVVQHTAGVGWDILIRMELLTPMLEHMERRRLTRGDVIRLGADICKALELCQRYNIIHRDIKPENIFISETGDFKLGDFGVARTLEKTTGGLSKKGTYTYMAPEIYRGEKYGPTVDIYSLGIVLYRLLNNNRAPFLPPPPQPITHSERERALQRRFSGEELPPPANAEGRLAEIVLKACAFDPRDRYSSPQQMRRELEALGSGSADAEPVCGGRHAAVPRGNVREDTLRPVTAPRAAAPEAQDRTVSVLHEGMRAKRESTAPAAPAEEDRAVSVPRERKSAPAAAAKGKNKTPLIAVLAAAAVVVIAALLVLLPKLKASDPAVSAAPAQAEATPEATPWVEGDWSWTLDDGVLTISGTGNMANFGYYDVPWSDSARSITGVVIEDGITGIGPFSFADFYKLSSLTIPEGVTAIGHYAFANCLALTSLSLPASLSSLGMQPFLGCNKLSKIEVAADNLSFKSVDGVLFTKDGGTLLSYPGGKPDEHYAIPDGVTRIGSESITGESLVSVSIPASVTDIDKRAVCFCDNLASFEVASDSIYFNAVDGVLFTKDCGTLLCYPEGKADERYMIPDGVTSIGDWAFENAFKLETLSIPSSVTDIGENAFCGCFALTQVTIPESVASIGLSAFYDCIRLTEVTILGNVTRIAPSMFSGCTNLARINLPASVTEIGTNAFKDCDMLKTVVFKGTKAMWEAVTVRDGNETLTSAEIVFTAA